MTDDHKLERATVRDAELEYEAQGAGEPVLFVHGAGVAATFLPLMDEPALDGYRLIRYHRRGYAGSARAAGTPAEFIEGAASDAAALLQHLDAAPAHVVAHSSGAIIALQAALTEPRAVRSLTLLEPAPLRVPTAQVIAGSLEQAAGRYFAGDHAGANDEFFGGAFGPEWRSEVTRTVPGGPEQADGDAATLFELELPALGAWDPDEAGMARITQPILTITGEETSPFNHECVERVHEWFPRAERQSIPGVGHLLQIRTPRPVAEAIAGFIARQ